MKARLIYAFLGLSLVTLPATSQSTRRWSPQKDGSIIWNIQNDLPHSDHIEMSGKSVSVVLRYGVDREGNFTLNKGMVWPLLRTVPNNTHASLMRRSAWNPLDAVLVNSRSLTEEKVESISLNGILTVESRFDKGYYGQWKLIREYFPSTDQPALIEQYSLINTGKNSLQVEIPEEQTRSKTNPENGVTGAYIMEGTVYGSGPHTVLPGDTLYFAASLSAHREGEPSIRLQPETEKAKRMDFLKQLADNLILETPDPVINRMFAFSKIRACESIYETKGGPMHGPGGESYYAAIWANDQAEYINPYFPFTGYAYGNASALNSFRHFARFMNDEWKPIPSSIIAEGLDIWNGAGDRGDAAMIAYGASRFALAGGDRQQAETLWPLIQWCLEYCHRKLTPEGVVASDADELEGRFPAGKANLCTSSLYYDALISAAFLAKDLGKDKKTAVTYRQQAADLRKSIEKYFGGTVEGYDTYHYYKGNDILRSWICIPLTVGISERKEGTIQALFSPRLWTENGLLTQAGDSTFWDRSTLYALRGVYAVGETEKATEYLKHYSSVRLLGEHVPYAIEAWPEGGQRHLSAESALYGRIITEGLFGIRPTGLKSCDVTPRLPQEWNQAALRRIRAFGSTFDITVERIRNGKLRVNIDGKSYTIREGETIHARLQ